MNVINFINDRSYTEFDSDFAEDLLLRLFENRKDLFEIFKPLTENSRAVRAVGGGFGALHNAVWEIYSKRSRSDAENVPVYDVYNSSIAAKLILNARNLIRNVEIHQDEATVKFKDTSHMDFGFYDFEGWCNLLDFETVLALVLFSIEHPNVKTIKGNILISDGIYTLNKISFPAKVISTEDQRYIIHMINGR